MSSEQARRENITDERQIQVEKDRVPKMASHFESLAEKVHAGSDVHPAGTGHVEVMTSVIATEPARHQGAHDHDKRESHQPPKIGGLEFSGGHAQKEKKQHQQGFDERPGGVKFVAHGQEQHKGSDINKDTQMQKQERSSMQHGKEVGAEERKGPSLDEISQLRGTAQQNSIETIRAAEERYEKAKNSASHGLGAAGTYAADKGAQAKDTITHGVHTGSQYAAEKAAAAKDTALDKGQKAYAATKDTLSRAGQTAVQSAQQAKDYAAQKAGDTKDYAAKKAEEAREKMSTTIGGESESTPEAGRSITQGITEQGKSAASYVGQKAVEAKDVTVETGKGAVGYAGKVAETVKEKTVVAGWGAAHFTAEKAADATKAMAGVASSVAGYTGEKVVGAKDVVAGVGKSAVGFAEDKLAAAKDYVVSAEESAAEYAARKKAEAERKFETTKPSESKEESRGEVIRERKQESFAPQDKTKESFEEESGGLGQEIKQQGGGVLQAIGETIVEIGKTTTDLVVGRTHPETGFQGGESMGMDKGQSQ